MASHISSKRQREGSHDEGSDRNVHRDPPRPSGASTTLNHLAAVAALARIPTPLSDLNGADGIQFKFTPRRVMRREQNGIPDLEDVAQYHPDDDRPEIKLFDAIDDDDVPTVTRLLDAHKKATGTSKLDLEFSPHDEFGNTALLHALQKEKPEIARLLADAGSNLEATNESGWTPILVAAEAPGGFEMVKWLSAKGANMMHAARGDFTLLHIAARAKGDQVDFVKYLMTETQVRDYNAKRDCDTMTPLANAAESGNLEVCKYLRNLEMTPGRLATNEEDEDDDEPIKTALHSAAERGHLKVAEFLLASNHDCLFRGELEVFVTDDNDQAPLHLAVINGHVNLITLLMEDSDPNRLDIIGLAPLHYAAIHSTNSVALVKAMLCMFHDRDVLWPINLKIRCRVGKTPAELARERSNHEAAQILDCFAARTKNGIQRSHFGEDEDDIEMFFDDDDSDSDYDDDDDSDEY